MRDGHIYMPPLFRKADIASTGSQNRTKPERQQRKMRVKMQIKTFRIKDNETEGKQDEKGEHRVPRQILFFFFF